MQKCSNRDTRSRILTAYLSKCIKTNPEIAKRILILKKSKAELLGFNCYSDYKLQKAMAKNTSTVMNFLNKLKNDLKPLLESDFELIRQRALNDGINEIQQYDISYYVKKISESIANVNMDELKQYFPQTKVINGLFEIYQSLFNVKYIDRTQLYSNTIWHSDVKLFEITDLSDNTIGYFYLDLYPREGKYPHAAVFPIIRKSNVKLPICIMTCNFDPISNLSIYQVETLFHEFGHVMHSMLSNAEYQALAGTTCERDFVETPSQMLEQWCYIDTVLDKITYPKIPSELINAVRKCKKLFKGEYYSKQLVFALTDMILHSEYNPSDPDNSTTPLDIYNNIFVDIIGLKPLIGTDFLASFVHIFTSYDAAYYGYMWSEAYAKDIYATKFKIGRAHV